MKRGEPLKRSEFKRKPPKPSEAAKRRRAAKREALQQRIEEWRKVRALVVDRSRGLCQAGIRGVCTVRGEHVHHVLLRSQGGPDEDWNLIHVCNACHGWIHAHPAEAVRLGLIRQRK